MTNQVLQLFRGQQIVAIFGVDFSDSIFQPQFLSPDFATSILQIRFFSPDFVTSIFWIRFNFLGLAPPLFPLLIHSLKCQKSQDINLMD